MHKSLQHTNHNEVTHVQRGWPCEWLVYNSFRWVPKFRNSWYNQNWLLPNGNTQHCWNFVGSNFETSPVQKLGTWTLLARMASGSKPKNNLRCCQPVGVHPVWPQNGVITWFFRQLVPISGGKSDAKNHEIFGIPHLARASTRASWEKRSDPFGSFVHGKRGYISDIMGYRSIFNHCLMGIQGDIMGIDNG